jgi:hypothetical protein
MVTPNICIFQTSCLPHPHSIGLKIHGVVVRTILNFKLYGEHWGLGTLACAFKPLKLTIVKKQNQQLPQRQTTHVNDQVYSVSLPKFQSVKTLFYDSIPHDCMLKIFHSQNLVFYDV